MSNRNSTVDKYSLPFYYWPFFSTSKERANGKHILGNAVTDLVAEDGHTHFYAYSVVDLPFCTGSAIGLFTGWASGFLSRTRVPVPTLPLPAGAPIALKRDLAFWVTTSSVTWRAAKRMLLAGIFTDLVERNILAERTGNFETINPWHLAIAGTLCAGVCGFRGGLKFMTMHMVGTGLSLSLYAQFKNPVSYNW